MPASDPSCSSFAAQTLARAAEGLGVGVEPFARLPVPKLPGAAASSKPVCSELPSPAAMSYLNSALWSFAKDGTKANYLVIVVL